MDVLGSGSQSQMQLGLRFAAAKLPGLRTHRGGQEPRGAKRGRWWPEEPFVDSGVSRHQPAVPLYNKQRQFGGAMAIYASSNLGSANPYEAQARQGTKAQ